MFLFVFWMNWRYVCTKTTFRNQLTFKKDKCCKHKSTPQNMISRISNLKKYLLVNLTTCVGMFFGNYIDGALKELVNFATRQTCHCVFSSFPQYWQENMQIPISFSLAFSFTFFIPFFCSCCVICYRHFIIEFLCGKLDSISLFGIRGPNWCGWIWWRGPPWKFR